MSLTRHFVTLSDRGRERQVHYRRQGDGPALLLLHQSPQSSREREPLMAQWSENFTVIAPDTPGYGLSDPLQKTDATMEDLADGVMEFADAIGLSRFGVYGYHTGGGMAVALAFMEPTDSPHGPLELLLTVDEEIGLVAARGLTPYLDAVARLLACQNALAHHLGEEAVRRV